MLKMFRYKRDLRRNSLYYSTKQTGELLGNLCEAVGLLMEDIWLSRR